MTIGETIIAGGVYALVLVAIDIIGSALLWTIYKAGERQPTTPVGEKKQRVGAGPDLRDVGFGAGVSANPIAHHRCHSRRCKGEGQAHYVLGNGQYQCSVCRRVR